METFVAIVGVISGCIAGHFISKMIWSSKSKVKHPMFAPGDPAWANFKQFLDGGVRGDRAFPIKVVDVTPTTYITTRIKNREGYTYWTYAEAEKFLSQRVIDDARA